jgi:glycosyltransferase involved in cell wall biosynthesis
MGEGMSQARWAVDVFVARDGCVFMSGWVAHPETQIAKVELALAFEDGVQTVCQAEYGTQRVDVVAQFPELPFGCGFLVYRALQHKGSIATARLQVTTEKGAVLTYPCHLPLGDMVPSSSQRASHSFERWTILRRDALRALKMFLSGDFASLRRGYGRRKSQLMLREGNQDNLSFELAQLASNSVLIIDHDMGGGANKFRNEWVRSFLASGRQVVMLTFLPHHLQFQLRLFKRADASPTVYVVDWRANEDLIACGRFGLVMFNNCVSFVDPMRVPVLLTAFKLKSKARLDVYLHDFFILCPSHFLMNSEKEFCGVPSTAACQTCLPKLSHGLAGLYKDADIVKWRAAWREVLEVADSVVYFSQSSRALLERAYPSLESKNLEFRPHAMSAPVGRFCYPVKSHTLSVAVVGQIGMHKGSEVIAALMAESAKQDVDLKVTVIGTFEKAFSHPKLHQTGPYKPEQLCALLSEHAIQLALMPSVWAETFSYVTHELIDLEVPLVAFNIGAQGEAVAAYHKGRVIPFGTPQELLGSLTSFKSELDQRYAS